MLYLIAGLWLFLGIHSVHIFAPRWREQCIARLGLWPWKGVFSVVSILGFVLIVWGYGQARQEATTLLWVPPTGLRHLASLLTLPAFILLVAAYVPHNHIRAKLGHPMVLAVKLWALAHLLVNGWLHAVVLFGAFLVWAVLSFRAARRRQPAPVVATPNVGMTALTVLVGIGAWIAFALWLHLPLIGAAPFG